MTKKLIALAMVLLMSGAFLEGSLLAKDGDKEKEKEKEKVKQCVSPGRYIQRPYEDY